MTMASLEHSYTPLGACAEVFARRDDEVLISGPAGTGKSRACLEKLHMIALLNPGMRGLILRKTLVSLGSTALVTWREQVIPEALAAGVCRFYGGSPQEAPAYIYGNGSVINIGGLDKPTRIMSSEYDVIYVQEATELNIEDWESMTTRLRNGRVSFQQLIADCNPGPPTHWLKVRADMGSTVMLHSRHEDNPRLFAAGGELTSYGATYIGKLDRLTGVRFQRLRRGVWAAAEGIIFEEFDPALHLVDRFPVPLEWPRYWVIDFGYTNPFVLQCWAQDPDGRLILYREIYHTKKTVDDHARDILAQVRRVHPDVAIAGREADWQRPSDWVWVEPRPREIICDHDAENRARFSRLVGMTTSPAIKGVLGGLQATQALLRPAGDGRPRLEIMRGAVVRRDPDLVDRKLPTCTEEEIPGYVWDTANGRAIKEVPLKENDHGCDCIRYLAAGLERGRPRIRRF